MRRGTRSVVVAVTAAGALLAACGGAAKPPGDAAEIDLDRVGHLSETDARAVAEASNAFGLDLHWALARPGENVITSPLSVSTLLAMVAAGAQGETAAQMAAVLHLDDVRNDRLGALLHQVSATNDVTLSVANALWGDTDATFTDTYRARVHDVFGATIEEVPLDDAATVDLIDDWVRERTAQRIDGIARDLGLPDPDAVLVLANAVYFLGTWTTAFDPASTDDRPFRLTDGTSVPVPTMHHTFEVDEGVTTARRNGYRVLRLPYGESKRYGMEIFVPDGELATLLDQLDATEWAHAVAGLEPTPFSLALPTFELRWQATLNDILADLGMPLAFTDGADFGAMTPTDVLLHRVVHTTYIRVDEEGTEAAAVTGVDVTVTSGPPEFDVDRPFAFTISDADTGTILFLGTVEDPRG